MGKNLPAKKHKVGNRTERFLQYTLNCEAGNDSHFIDLAAGISAVNKRFYRQGLYYYIKSIQVVETTQNSVVKFGTAPDVWHVPNAWKLGFRNWSKMNSKAAEGLGDDLEIAGRYHDFKIYLNNNHRTDPDVAVPSNGPESMDGTPDFDPAEWEYSKINSKFPANADTPNNADRDTFDLMLLGTSHQSGAGGADEYAAVSLCLSYLKQKNLQASGSRDNPHQFDDMGDDPLLRIFDSTTAYQDTLDDLQDDNDMPPYVENSTYADTICRAQAAVGPTSSSTAIMPGFCVPFGLLEVLTNCEGSNELTILIEMAPGPYHGVYAERVV